MATKLAGLIAPKEDYAPRLLSIFFKHRCPLATSARHCTNLPKRSLRSRIPFLFCSFPCLRLDGLLLQVEMLFD
jgi:hypothetical protein